MWKVVAYFIHLLNVVKDVEASQYSGETEGNDTISMVLHDSTFDPSDVSTHK